MFKLFGGAACAALLFSTGAAAAVQTVTFDIRDRPDLGYFWVGYGTPPYGMSANPILVGSFDIEDTTNEILTFDFTTGSRVWGLADIDPANSFFHYREAADHGIDGFTIDFWDYGTFISITGATRFDDGQATLGCGGCGVVTSAVPEPATWAFMIAGFGLAGSALRARRPRLVPTP